MRAVVLEQPRSAPRFHADWPEPVPAPGEVLVEVEACAVCRTDLHVVDGELPDVRVPIIPGHEVVGRVVRRGEGAVLPEGARVGIPWLGWTDGICAFCEAGQENLCDHARFTGYDRDGGYAELIVVDARFAFPLPEDADALQLAPLMCAGVIGYRAYGFAEDAQRLGLYGFGASAHILLQVARHDGREVYAFTRPGDTEGQSLARELGAVWAGGSDVLPPEPLDAALLFAPVGSLVPAALRAVRKAGVVVCAGIHMSDIPSFPYALLWGERVVRSVANLTRMDTARFLALAPKVPVRSTVKTYPLEEAPRALDDLRSGRVHGAAVLVVRPGR
ncbi:MAG: zinc-dependent alcohol dehydrogenase family protein [Myxococcaceae bacterium]|nr:zinc-dependent alcohol dehydrogenase family protein [Myxococcaceae bacterium]